jgi:hypothetical protein
VAAASLVEDALAVLADLKWPVLEHRSNTRVHFGAPSQDGFRGGVFLDVDGVRAHVTCYPFNSEERVSEERIRAVSELMNLIAASGVPFALALDLDERVPSMRNEAYILADSERDRRLALRDLVVRVATSRVVYERPLRQVAFAAVDPASALAEVEQFLDDYPGA